MIQRGTGTAAGLRVPAAGKTGTTDDNRDAWFAGYTCKITTAVWMGYDTPAEMVYQGRKVTGGSFPAEIWRDYMLQATDGDDECDYVGADAGEEVLNSRMVPASETTTTAAPTTTEPEGSTTTTTEAGEGQQGSTTTTSSAPASSTTSAPPSSTTSAPAGPDG
ncbi:MAG: hypothetical protein R2716_01680 [Microthrixaceae bacterium]